MAEIDGRTEMGRWIEMNTCCKVDLQNAMSQGLKRLFWVNRTQMENVVKSTLTVKLVNAVKVVTTTNDLVVGKEW